MTERPPGPISLNRYELELAWQGIPTFMKLPVCLTPEDLRAGGVDVAVGGAPWDGTALTRAGTHMGPQAIRTCDHLPAPPYGRPHLHVRVDPFEHLTVCDYGDAEIIIGSTDRTFENIRSFVAEILEGGAIPVILGGDHGITWPAATAVADVYGYGKIGIVHFDAHADTAPDMQGVLAGHGTPMRRLIESGAVLGRNFVQVGLRGYWPTPDIVAWMEEQQMHSHFMAEVQRHGFETVLERAIDEALSGSADRLYISVDVDAVDPAHAPGHGLAGAGRTHQRRGAGCGTPHVCRGRHGRHGRRRGQPALRLGQQHHRPLRPPVRAGGAHRDRHAPTRADVPGLPRRVGRRRPVGRVCPVSLVHDDLYDAAGYAVLGATSLASLYTDEDVLAAERARLFSRSWVLVADAHELSAPGSYVTGSAGGIPLAIVRGRDDTLRTFHNVCRHRGITLLEGSGCVGRFMTCPYHQWSYATTGELAHVPQEEQFDALDRCGLGLVPGQVAEWGGMVFANPSSDAPGLPESMAGLDQRLHGFLAGPLHQVAVVRYEAACNWKLLVENHIDVYHLWYLHARSLAAYDHRKFRWESLGDNWWSLEPMKVPAGPGGLPWVSEDMRHHIGAFLLFPNLMLVTTDEYFATYDAEPVAPDRTVLTLRVRSSADADADALVASIRSFMAEDVAACERMQHGAASPSFGVGALATTHEEPIRRFHASLLRAVAR